MTKWLVAALAMSSAGCGYGLHESARTLAPGRFGGGGAVTVVANAAGDDAKTHVRNVGLDLGMMRVGVARHVDVGFGVAYLAGGRADVKLSMLHEDYPLALAVRVGVGGAAAPIALAFAYVGVLASVDAASWLQPYVGCTFADHWIFGLDQRSPPLGQRLAARAGYGDGVLQNVVGFRFFLEEGTLPVSLSLEYGLWVPLQDDPGDGFSFVLNHLGSLGVCMGCPQRGASPKPSAH